LHMYISSRRAQWQYTFSSSEECSHSDTQWVSHFTCQQDTKSYYNFELSVIVFARNFVFGW